MNFLEQRLAAAKAAKAQSTYAPQAPGNFVVELPEDKPDDDIVAQLEQQLKTASEHELELHPRQTVLRFLVEKQMDELFTFKTQLGRGANYVQAMRQVLSRSRNKALAKKVPLQEFKVYEIEIKSEKDHDIVTLMRTRRLLEKEQSVYDELIAKFARTPLTNK